MERRKIYQGHSENIYGKVKGMQGENLKIGQGVNRAKEKREILKMESKGRAMYVGIIKSVTALGM